MLAKLLFQTHVEPHLRKTESCWFYQRAHHSAGYGVFRFNRKMYYTHRVSYEAHFGEIPLGMFIMHLCNNTACCNPQHLRIGDHQDNMIYMGRCGRKPLSGSGIQGVYYHKNRDRWEARASRPTNHTLYIGPSKEQAIAAREAWEEETTFRINPMEGLK